MNKIVCSIVFAFSISSCLVSQDIQSSSTGFSVSAAFSYSTWNSESFFLGDLAELEPTGIGIKIGAGYGFNERISVHANYYGLSFKQENEWETFNITLQTLSARWTFGATLSKWRPSFEAGLAYGRNKVDPVQFDGFDELEVINSGFGIHLGGGINYYVTTNIAVHILGDYVFGNFTSTTLSGIEFSPDEDVDYTVLNINFGVRYFFD